MCQVDMWDATTPVDGSERGGPQDQLRLSITQFLHFTASASTDKPEVPSSPAAGFAYVSPGGVRGRFAVCQLPDV